MAKFIEAIFRAHLMLLLFLLEKSEERCLKSQSADLCGDYNYDRSQDELIVFCEDSVSPSDEDILNGRLYPYYLYGRTLTVNCIIIDNIISYSRTSCLDTLILLVTNSDTTNISICSNSRLQKLSFVSCNISQFDKPIYDFQNLEMLNLAFNSIEKFDFFQINDALTNLNLSNNQIDSIESSEEMKGLVIFDLSHNKINNLPPNAFERLEILNLAANSIQHFDFDVVNVALTNLNLSQNQINSMKPSKEIKSLKIVDLSKNKISNLQRNLFENLPNLKVLNISWNFLTQIEANSMFHLNKLEILQFGNNNLSTIQFGGLNGLSALKEAYFQNNSLKTLPKGTFFHINLEKLDLSENYLNEIDAETFLGMDKFKEFKLRGNNVNNIRKKVFDQLETIETLDISFNFLTNISSDLFEHLQNLQVLLINNNQLKTCPNLNNQSDTLKQLNISENRIGECFLGKLNRLEILDISNNNFAFVPKINSQNLLHLDLDSNKIKTINEEDFINLTELTFLDLSSNEISNISFGFFASMQNMLYLDLSYNRIKLKTGIFSNLKKLETLKLKGLQITNFSITYLHNMENLRILDLSENYLTQLNVYDIRTYLKKLREIDLQSNNFSCTVLLQIKHMFDNSEFSQFSSNFKIKTNVPNFKTYNIDGITCTENDLQLSKTEAITEQTKYLSSKEHINKTIEHKTTSININLLENISICILFVLIVILFFMGYNYYLKHRSNASQNNNILLQEQNTLE